MLIPVALYLTAAFSGGHATLARLLLCREPDPAEAELVEVTRSRARLADAFDAERRRIERDLHDVAQQRLVSGYLLKDRIAAVAEFAAMLRRVAAGGTVVDPEVVRQLMQRGRDPVDRLSPREREVLALIAEGHSNAATARIGRAAGRATNAVVRGGLG